MAVLLYRIVSEDPLPMRQFVPNLPDFVERAVARAMSKQKEDRFTSTRDFLVALAGGDASTRIPSGLEHEAVGGRLVTPRGSNAMTTSGAMGLVAGERSARSVEVPPRSRSRAVSFVVGLGAALGLAFAIHAVRTRPRLPEAPTLPPRAAESPPAPPPIPTPPPKSAAPTEGETTAASPPPVAEPDPHAQADKPPRNKPVVRPPRKPRPKPSVVLAPDPPPPPPSKKGVGILLDDI
jgi:hypothetical protein